MSRSYIIKWDEKKNELNKIKHCVSFEEAETVFEDLCVVITIDYTHSTKEELRMYAIGRVNGGVLTVRFTVRDMYIRIYGAGFWRKYRKLYKKNSI